MPYFNHDKNAVVPIELILHEPDQIQNKEGESTIDEDSDATVPCESEDLTDGSDLTDLTDTEEEDCSDDEDYDEGDDEDYDEQYVIREKVSVKMAELLEIFNQLDSESKIATSNAIIALITLAKNNKNSILVY